MICSCGSKSVKLFLDQSPAGVTSVFIGSLTTHDLCVISVSSTGLSSSSSSTDNMFVINHLQLTIVCVPHYKPFFCDHQQHRSLHHHQLHPYMVTQLIVTSFHFISPTFDSFGTRFLANCFYLYKWTTRRTAFNVKLLHMPLFFFLPVMAIGTVLANIIKHSWGQEMFYILRHTQASTQLNPTQQLPWLSFHLLLSQFSIHRQMGVSCTVFLIIKFSVFFFLKKRICYFDTILTSHLLATHSATIIINFYR